MSIATSISRRLISRISPASFPTNLILDCLKHSLNSSFSKTITLAISGSFFRRSTFLLLQRKCTLASGRLRFISFIRGVENRTSPMPKVFTMRILSAFIYAGSQALDAPHGEPKEGREVQRVEVGVKETVHKKRHGAQRQPQYKRIPECCRIADGLPHIS